MAKAESVEGAKTYETLSIERRGAILVATLNRGPSLNSLNDVMVEELTDLFHGLHSRADVRVVILRADGRAFCAGADLSSWGLEPGEGQTHRTYALQRSIARIMKLMRSCPQPVIGLGHGPACGGGFSLLLSCDVRIAAPSLRMNAAYIRIGLGGCDMGSSYFLPRLVGMSIASELLLTGDFIHADRALRVGLVSDIVPEEELLDRGLAMAERMLSTNPLGLRMTKDALNLAVDAPSLDAVMAVEDRQQIVIAATADADEALKAFFEKRPPVYRDV
jgi:enoyl-CoA hydratase/carnithine racemase